ncbi:MAG: HEAT repeat domain-containing protein [Planctomycetes bacterium]|nr:HEAT repeat domain-containing protein [Planctomycetota bacterium]
MYRRALRVLLMFWVVLAVPAQDDPAMAFAALEQGQEARRRAFDHDALLAEYRALQPRLVAVAAAAEQNQRLTTRLADLAVEAALLGRIGPLPELRSRPLAAVLGALATAAGNVAEELAAARFCYLVADPIAAEAALIRARERDLGCKDATDQLLAQARGVPVPAGGFHVWRGVFLPLLERDRARSIDTALDALAATGLPAAAAPVPLAADRSAAAPFLALGEGGPAFLVRAATALRTELRADYATVRGWLPSYAKDQGLRDALIGHGAKVAPLRQKALELIRRYDKPEQPQVDELRAQLEALDDEAMRLQRRDREALAKVRADEAFACLQRVAAREQALVQVHTALQALGSGGLPAVPVLRASGAATSEGRRLPGRSQSELEDVLWCLLHFAADQLGDCVQRCDELLRHRGTLTPWEQWLLATLQDEVIERFHDRLAVSLDLEEWAFVQRLNRYRRALGLRPFELEERCNVSARKHSQEMVDLAYFGHISPVARNKTPTDRLRLEGYGGGVGENCYAGSAGGEDAFEAWYHSPGHHRNLISGGPHLGIGCARGTGMWTMVAGGTDYSWRALHADLPPARSAALRALVAELRKVSMAEPRIAAERKVAADLRAAVLAEVPAILPFAARVAFPACNPRAPEHPAAAELLALLIEPELPPAWRSLQIAAVSAAIDLFERGQATVRVRALALVAPLLGNTFGADPTQPDAHRQKAAAQMRQLWEDDAQWRFRRAGDEAKPPVGRSLPGGRGLPANAKRRVLGKPERLQLAKKHGGGGKSEAALEAALAWLAKVQEPDGSFLGRSFALRDKRFTAPTAGIGHHDFDIAMTGLVLLAFVSAGYTQEQGEYRQLVRKAADYLLVRIGDYGRFDTTAGHYMYNHAIATQALCELFAATGDPGIGAGAQQAVDFLVYAQHAPSGGWRYEANEHGDTSVVGWVLMALNSAYKAELSVAGFRDALRFIDGTTTPGYYQVGYQGPIPAGHGENLRLTSVGLTARFFLGQTAEHPKIKLPSFRLLANLPNAKAPDFYYWYYATLALFQIGGEPWQKWNSALLEALLALQDDERGSPYQGSWPPQGPWADVGGRLYQTAIGALLLTTYYRYDRGAKQRIHPFTGDLLAELAPYLATLRNPGDERDKLLVERRMVEHFGPSLAGPALRILREGKEPKELRHRLARLLVAVAEPAHAAALLEVLADGDGTIAEAAAQALGNVCSPEQRPALEHALQSPHRAVRAFSARALGRLGEPSAAAALGARLQHEGDGWVRDEIGRSLGLLSHRSALQDLIAAALGNDRSGWLLVFEALDVLQTGELGRRVQALAQSEPKLWQECVAAVRSHRHGAVVPMLLVLLESGDEAIRTESIKMFRALTGRLDGYDPKAPEAARRKALAEIAKWWSEHKGGFLPGR